MSWLRRYAIALACTVAAVGFAILAHHSTGIEHWIFIFGYQIASVLFGGAVCAELVFGGLKNNLGALAVLNGLLRQLKAGQPFEWGGRTWQRLPPPGHFELFELPPQIKAAADAALAEVRRSDTPVDCCEALVCGEPGSADSAHAAADPAAPIWTGLACEDPAVVDRYIRRKAQAAADAAAEHDITAKVIVADDADLAGSHDRSAEDKDSSCGP